MAKQQIIKQLYTIQSGTDLSRGKRQKVKRILRMYDHSPLSLPCVEQGGKTRTN